MSSNTTSLISIMEYKIIHLSLNLPSAVQKLKVRSLVKYKNDYLMRKTIHIVHFSQMFPDLKGTEDNKLVTILRYI